MKRILFLLSLSGMLFADQTFVLTFGTEDKNSYTTESANGIMNNSDSLTYNVVSANRYYSIPNIVDTNNVSSISISLASSANQDDYIETNTGSITSIKDNSGIISSIFGTAKIKGVLMTTNNDIATITFSELNKGTYTLYALGARGSKGSANWETSYKLNGNENINSLSCKILAHGQSTPKIENNVITASTFNNSGEVSNWVLMEYNFDVSKDDTNIFFQSYGHSGNIAAVALVFHSTPEPATTTLSLLALAALASRRKRK